jgi:hypothetical protein
MESDTAVVARLMTAEIHPFAMDEASSVGQVASAIA